MEERKPKKKKKRKVRRRKSRVEGKNDNDGEVEVGSGGKNAAQGFWDPKPENGEKIEWTAQVRISLEQGRWWW